VGIFKAVSFITELDRHAVSVMWHHSLDLSLKTFAETQRAPFEVIVTWHWNVGTYVYISPNMHSAEKKRSDRHFCRLRDSSASVWGRSRHVLGADACAPRNEGYVNR
jgi:hypothetical protein